MTVLTHYRTDSHARATKDMVNTFGLVYTLEGTDAGLKPLMLTAHQDVVPVADASTWKYPPFSAHFDGRWLWGRGASDGMICSAFFPVLIIACPAPYVLMEECLSGRQRSVC